MEKICEKCDYYSDGMCCCPDSHSFLLEAISFCEYWVEKITK